MLLPKLERGSDSLEIAVSHDDIHVAAGIHTERYQTSIPPRGYLTD